MHALKELLDFILCASITRFSKYSEGLCMYMSSLPPHFCSDVNSHTIHTAVFQFGMSATPPIHMPDQKRPCLPKVWHRKFPVHCFDRLSPNNAGGGRKKKMRSRRPQRGSMCQEFERSSHKRHRSGWRIIFQQHSTYTKKKGP